MAELRFTILGCGSSGGVPRLGGHWGACDPENPRNQRRRCSMLVELLAGDDVTRVLIDSSPDLRAQLLDAGVGWLDAVVYTHPHADHVHGVDDLRMVVFNRRSRLPVWADTQTQMALTRSFGYVFTQPEWSSYPPILELNAIGEKPFSVPGPAGEITFEPIPVEHGEITALGFRIGGLAYIPDISAMTEAAWAAVDGLDIWIVDALRPKPHPSHSHLEQTLQWIEQAAPKQAVLTNMHIDLDYQTVRDTTPPNVEPAYDGMTLSLPA